MAEFICQHCGNKQLRNSNGNVITNFKKIDVTAQYFCTECGAELPKEQMGAIVKATAEETLVANNLAEQGRNAKNSGDFGSAGEYYQQLLLHDPNSWEAKYFTVSCNCRSGFGVNENACDAIKACLEGVFDLIAAAPEWQQRSAVMIVVADACSFALETFDAAVRQHAALDASTMSQHNGILKNQLISALNIVIACASNIMKWFGDNDEIAAIVETPATCALQMQSRQQFVSLTLEAETARTLLEWVGRFNLTWVEEYKKKQNRAMASGTIFLMILGTIMLVLGLVLEGVFGKAFCLIMAAFCLIAGIFRIIVQVANKKLNG